MAKSDTVSPISVRLHSHIDQVLIDHRTTSSVREQEGGYVTVDVSEMMDEDAARKLRDDLSQVLGEMTRRRRRRETGGR